MITNTTGHVRKISIKKLKYVFIVDPIAMVILKATSTSIMFRSEDTYNTKYQIM